MQLIIAMIQPKRLEDVQGAMHELGISRMTAVDVRGYGKQKGHRSIFRGREYEIVFTKKTKVEILVKNQQESQKAVSGLVLACWTGTIGDGKIYSLPVEEVIRIRTGEKDSNAI